ncbi:glyoxalase [Kineococcus sp. R8]|uniref:VOC family protein n=1 Tax=Kineococcus siccus TaxID=2696567 RepID=UPI0014131CD2|nr:VOC family protein [Kineococcus siccus]NAZ82075.1 glyoxalase [Kineococcus siccus]
MTADSTTAGSTTAGSTTESPAGSATRADRTPPPQVWPCLRATDARALIRFLVDAFGFVEVAAYGEGDVVAHAELSWPEGGGVMLGSDRPGEQPRPGSWGPGSSCCYVVSDHVDELHERAVAAGARILVPPTDTDYGSRDFTAADPEGNQWAFGTYRGEPHPG